MITQINLSKILKNFENKWVALSPDYKKVIASGKTLEDTVEKLKITERDWVIFHKVIPINYAPTAY